MIAGGADQPDHDRSWCPRSAPGNMNVTMMKPANPSPISEAKPRQRATTITTAAKSKPNTSSGVPRSKSENWYCAG